MRACRRCIASTCQRSGRSTIAEARGFADGHGRHRCRRARGGVRRRAGGLPRRQGHRRRLSQRARLGDSRRHGQRQPPLLPIERSGPERDRAKRRRHRIRLLRRRPLRSRPARYHSALPNRPSAKAVRSREPKPIEPSTYPVILEPQAVSDLMGFLTNSFDARTADEGRSAFSGEGWQDAPRREAVQRADQPLQRPDAPRACPRCRAPTRASRRRGCRSSKQARSRTSSTRGSGRRSASASRRQGR